LYSGLRCRAIRQTGTQVLKKQATVRYAEDSSSV